MIPTFVKRIIKAAALTCTYPWAVYAGSLLSYVNQSLAETPVACFCLGRVLPASLHKHAEDAATVVHELVLDRPCVEQDAVRAEPASQAACACARVPGACSNHASCCAPALDQANGPGAGACAARRRAAALASPRPKLPVQEQRRTGESNRTSNPKYSVNTQRLEAQLQL